MSYSLTRHLKRFLLVPVGVISMTGAVHSADWGSLSDGLCNYCAEHGSGNLQAKTITTSYSPLLRLSRSAHHWLDPLPPFQSRKHALKSRCYL